ncbi:MAG: ribonuclease Z [Deltaproteobacteria bacterium]|nr:MAG: ribonuclease Z [Deltaproteobacteria bacterium]
MSIEFQVLGGPKDDNALHVQVNSGQQVERYLFDCGQQCLNALSFGEIQDLDGLFFSHFHMDHVAGFDGYFRANYTRTSKPNIIWGPPDTARVMHHRFRAYTWNLASEMDSTWWVHEIHEAEIRRYRYELKEAFETLHEEEPWPLHDSVIIDTDTCTIQAVPMDHRTPSMTYTIREKTKKNIDTSRLKDLGLKPGPWLQQVKQADVSEDAMVLVHGEERNVRELQEALLVSSEGDSLAYLTDFIMGKSVGKELVPVIQGCRWLVCESQYLHKDLELARANYHMTSRQVGKIAAMAEAGELILFHLSVRYTPEEWMEMLAEAKAEFPNVRFSEHWGMKE